MVFQNPQFKLFNVMKVEINKSVSDLLVCFHKASSNDGDANS